MSIKFKCMRFISRYRSEAVGFII